ncbi:unnamed protein product [Prunus brigantina]
MNFKAGGHENMAFMEKDCTNYINKVRRLQLGEGDATAIQKYFLKMQPQNANFFCAIDLDESDVNHHGHSTLLGCGLISSEDTETFVWLFKVWLACMFGHAPYGIIIDQDRAMTNSIEIVFPNTRHHCTHYFMEKQAQSVYTIAKFKEFQDELTGKMYCEVVDTKEMVQKYIFEDGGKM